MTNPRVKPGGWSVGEKLTSAQMNAIDLAQVGCWPLTGVTPLTGGTTIQGGGKSLLLDMSDNPASLLQLKLGTQDIAIVPVGGGGQFVCPSTAFTFSGTGWPTLRTTRTVAQFYPTLAWMYDSVWTITQGSAGGSGSIVTTGAGSVSTGVATCTLGGLPPGMTLTGLTLEVTGPGAQASLPSTMPQVTFGYYAVGAGGTPTALFATNQADTASPNANYIVNHTIAITGLSHTVASSNSYVLSVRAPYGGGTVAGFTVWRLYVTGTLATWQAF